MSRRYAFPGTAARRRCSDSVVISPAWASPNAARGRTSRLSAYFTVCGAAEYWRMNRSASSESVIGAMYAPPCSRRPSWTLRSRRASPFVLTVFVEQRFPPSCHWPRHPFPFRPTDPVCTTRLPGRRRRRYPSPGGSSPWRASLRAHFAGFGACHRVGGRPRGRPASIQRRIVRGEKPRSSATWATVRYRFIAALLARRGTSRAVGHWARAGG